MKALLRWMSNDEGWKSTMAVVYAIICIFDFIIVPSWVGLSRHDIVAQLDSAAILALDPVVQVRILESLSRQHMPFTLQGGGLFHIAYGALLTGSAITKRNHSS